MSTFNVSMLLTADADQAQRELRETRGDLQALGTSARQAGTATAAGLKVAEAQVVQLKHSTAGATSNLVAQFNDVGQMLAAGQSPLLLAAQQGTQIAQALGPLGARGAVQALGGAFLGALNPVNLAVFAAVAALGILGNALRGVFGETKSVGDALGDLEGATKAWRDAARVGLSDLKREFGSITPEIVEMQRQITELALVETLIRATDAAAALSGQFDKIFDRKNRDGSIASLLKVDASVVDVDPAYGKVRKRNPLVEQVDAQFAKLTGSASTDEQLAAVRAIRDIVSGTVDLRAKENQEQRDFVQNLLSIERTLQTIKAAQEGIGSAQQVATDRAGQMLVALREEAGIRQLIRRFGEDSVEVANARAAAERRTFEAQLEGMDLAAGLRDDLRAAWEAANGAGTGVKGLVSSLLGAVGASDDTRRAVQEAWDAISGATDATGVWAGVMSGVAAEVRGIGAALATLGGAGIANAAKQIEIEALKSGQSVAEARRTVVEAEIKREGEARLRSAENVAIRGAILAETETRLRGVELDRQLEAERKAAAERERLATKGASGASGARSSAAQASGALRLVGALERELELLRATDPVQKEMIRNREALAGATEAERRVVEELIATKIRETEAQARAQETWDFAKQTAFETLDALIVQGESASEVFANLAKTIASALLQSALLGSGPLAGLFGGAGAGLFGLFGGGGGGDLFANIGGFASGGMVHGPGGPRDDAIFARLSAGEFVVNAAAAARHRPMLEAINAAPRFAAGGAVGGGTAPFATGLPGGGPIVIELRLSDDLDARITETSQQVSLRVMRGGIEDYDAKVLPRRMKAIGADPRRTG